MPAPPQEPLLRLGVSTCLLGEKVRFDGGHKRNRFLTDLLGPLCTWVPVCPEVEMGLPTPRESLRLVGDPTSPRLLERRTGVDHTTAMVRFSRERLRALRDADLDGYVLKKDSPSCGMARVRVWHDGGGGAQRKGIGIFTRILMDGLPLLPVEEEGRLQDLPLRENFIERVFCYRRLKGLLSGRAKAGALVQFHTRHKLTMLAHSRTHYQELGRLVAEAGNRALRPLLEEYAHLFMEGLRRKATRSKHTNVLQHLVGYLRRSLDAEDRQELVEVVESYRQGEVPLVVPVTLLKHHFRRHPVDWVQEQVYLNPYPAELMLRNHV